MNVKRVSLDRLSLPERNVRIHSSTQLREYARSVEKFDQTKPILCDENYMILAGAGLYETLKSLGRKQAWVNVIPGLSEADKKKLMLSDNRIFELGITDNDAIDAILKDLPADFDIPGFEPEMLEMLSRSFQETDAVVAEYGRFDPAETARLDSRPVEDHMEGRPAPAQAPSTPPTEQPISQHPPGGESAPERREASVGGVEQPAHAEPGGEEPDSGGRFIICPKCGERIWL